MLIVEVDGSETTCERDSERIAGVCEDVGALELLVAQDASQRDRLWAARREMSPAVRRMARNKLSEDIVVPRAALAEFLTRLEALSERWSVRTLSYGHAGDGNLHVNFLWDDSDEEERVKEAIETMFREVIDLRGTLTGEHGVGILKAPYMPLEQPPGLLELQRSLKRVFDPKGLLNPGKILPG